jgi:hypothetical protein
MQALKMDPMVSQIPGDQRYLEGHKPHTPIKSRTVLVTPNSISTLKQHATQVHLSNEQLQAGLPLGVPLLHAISS